MTFTTHEDHSYIALFDSRQARDAFQRNFKAEQPMSCEVVADKKINRMVTAIETLETTGLVGAGYAQNALRLIHVSNNPLAMILGLREDKHGVLICPHCLNAAILQYEESLQHLKSIQEQLTENATR